MKKEVKSLTCGVYALLKEKEINYVGSSIRIEIRIKQHCNYQHNLDYIILEECNKDVLFEREKFWIQKLSNEGVRLTNKLYYKRKPPKRYKLFTLPIEVLERERRKKS